MRPMKLAAALFAALPLMISAAPALSDETPVRMVDPIFAQQPAWAVRKYGGPGLFFPEKADRGRLVTGTAVIQCVLAANGALDGCAVVSETPADYGFGDAALKMAERRALTATPRIDDGHPVGGEVVRLAIDFGHPKN